MPPLNLQEISDRLEIDDLLTRYATGVDRRDWDLWETCFTPDALIDYSAFGGIRGNVKEVRRWLEEIMVRFSMTQHLVINREVQLNGDTATCRSGFYNPMALPIGEERLLFFCGGYYCDQLVRTAQGWRIRERIEEFSYSTQTQATMQVRLKQQGESAKRESK